MIDGDGISSPWSGAFGSGDELEDNDVAVVDDIAGNSSRLNHLLIPSRSVSVRRCLDHEYKFSSVELPSVHVDILQSSTNCSSSRNTSLSHHIEYTIFI